MRAVGQGQPLLAGELDRGLLSEGGLIASDLLVIHELGDNYIVSLDVGDGVGLREVPGLQAEICVGARDRRGGVGALEGEASVSCAALAVRDGDREGIHRVKTQGVELLCGDGQGQSLASRGVVDGAERLLTESLGDSQRVAVRVIDGVLVGEAQVLVAEVGVGAGDAGGRVGSGERPRPGSCAALSIADDYLDRVGAEAQFIDGDGDRIYRISRRGKRLRRLPINRLRRRQDVAGVGVVDGVGDREVAVLIAEISVTVRDQRVSVQDFKDGAEAEVRVLARSSVAIPAAGRITPTERAIRRILRIRLLAPRIDTSPMPQGVVCAVLVGGVEGAVQVGRDGSREAGDDLLACDEPIPLIVRRRATRIVVVIPSVAAARQGAALILRAVDRDFLACDVALTVQVIPGARDQDDTVADKQRLIAILYLNPLKLICFGGRSVAEGVVRHAAGHLRDVADAAHVARSRVRPPGLCRARQNGAAFVKSAELDGSEILRHKVALLPFL